MGMLTNLPHFIVVPGSDRRDFFAWVNTFCPFVTPLSQWCRVVTAARTGGGTGRPGAAEVWRRRGRLGGRDDRGSRPAHGDGRETRAVVDRGAAHVCHVRGGQSVWIVGGSGQARGGDGAISGGKGDSWRYGARDVRSPDYERAWEVLEVLSGGKDRMRQGGLWEEDWTVAAMRGYTENGVCRQGNDDQGSGTAWMVRGLPRV